MVLGRHVKKKIDDEIREEIKKLLKFETLKSVVKKISSKTDYSKTAIYNEALKIKEKNRIS